ncbi:radical SAM protein [uncultured Desulfobacter sp.]|uniref:radical SAM/SPASM domain-containing protein n=1 Tax=uncultured Desulfobacter sp. TaxID=240139 RepID=UPI0029F4E986|nr:radical SAM protein [uncultured Desulfobacter sp.]
MTQDRYGIDTHKLMFHPERVAAWRSARQEWQELKSIYPLYVEISPFGACNHRCTFCALDYMGYKPHSLPLTIMKNRLAEMGKLGVKSVMFAGEGEPLLYKEINELAASAVSAGIDIAFTTNGVLMNQDFIETTLPQTSWIKVSCNAGTPETYSLVHNTSPKDFIRVCENLTKAVQIRDAHQTKVAIGVQMLLLPENASEAEILARICRDEIGADYLVIKPYSQHKQSLTRKYETIDYNNWLYLEEALAKLNNNRFHVVFRTQTMRKYLKKRVYETCLSTPFFWAYVASSGDLYTCSAYLGDQRFNIGNLLENDFKTIWEGSNRKANWELIKSGLDIESCRLNCRMDAINIYLWQLKNPPYHVNFI